jgi:uncharacterized membrane protein
VHRCALAAALLAAAAFPLALLALRIRVADDTLTFRFLLWNLFLAGLPVAFALGLDAAARSGRRVVAAACAALWLLFFPNAPYLVTDLIHLRERPPTPLWFDALVLASAGVAGLLAGFASLRLVQVVAARRVGTAWSWVGALVLLFACGFGVYLGRFGRYNSWDVLTRPRSLLYGGALQQGDPLAARRAVAVTLLFSGFLIVGYLVVIAVSTVRPDPLSGRPDGRAAGRGGGRG